MGIVPYYTYYRMFQAELDQNLQDFLKKKSTHTMERPNSGKRDAFITHVLPVLLL